MVNIVESQQIAGLYLTELTPYKDERGRFLEIFRQEWFPQRRWAVTQTNRSDSRAGVLRGLHYHFHQVDYWYVMNGRIRAGLVDIRPDSPTCGATQIVEMHTGRNIGLFIPVGVAHGFAALSDVTLTYIVDNYYDSNDEYGIAWDDPQIGLDWGLDKPFLSPRDADNPQLAQIPDSELPRYAQSSERRPR